MSHRRILLLCIAVSVSVEAHAQGSVPPAAAADPVRAVLDSSTTRVDSIPPSRENPAAVAALDARTRPPRPIRAPLDELVGTELLEWRRADTLEDVVESVPGASLRVAGDTGMPAFLSLSPISGTAPELFVDGIPTRSPADRDPGVFDRSAIGVGAVMGRRPDGVASWGGPQLWLESDAPLEGRTFFRSAFSAVRQDETYARGISVTTPASGRVFRFDFEEWKTEEGIEYSLAPDVVSDVTRRGRSKMRRFRVASDLQTDLGRLKFTFGRGRRFHRGTPLRATSTERWTGELAVGLDHRGEARSWRLRAYHLDAHDEDEAYAQTDSGSRTGLRVDLTPEGSGLEAGFSAETRAARFVSPQPTETLESFARTHEVRMALGWRPAPLASNRAWAMLEGAWSEHTDQRYAGAGSAGIERRFGRLSAGASAERVLRTPTLSETTGVFSFDAVRPTVGGFVYDEFQREWKVRGNGSLAFEKQDRFGMWLGSEWGGLRLRADFEHHRLRDGVGVAPTADQRLLVVGERVLDVDQLRLQWFWGRERGKWRLRSWGHAHRVLGDLDLDGGRGSGWPLQAVRARVGVDRRFFAPHNRLGFDVELDHLGEHADDLTGAFGGSVPASTVVDVELWLSLRQAHLGLAYDNLLDAERSEVLGTYRRGRQMRLILRWPFTN